MHLTISHATKKTQMFDSPTLIVPLCCGLHFSAEKLTTNQQPHNRSGLFTLIHRANGLSNALRSIKTCDTHPHVTLDDAGAPSLQ